MSTWWAYYGATAPPFPRDLPVSQLLPTPAHREWAARFQTTVADRGFAVLTGEAGVGKSTARRAVWETLSPNQFWPVYLAASGDWPPPWGAPAPGSRRRRNSRYGTRCGR